MRPENPGSQVVFLRLRGSSACRFVVNQMLTGISDLSEGCVVKRSPRSKVFPFKNFYWNFFSFAGVDVPVFIAGIWVQHTVILRGANQGELVRSHQPVSASRRSGTPSSENRQGLRTV
jgi:hypothetical protein